jgi:glycosyltransferase involved in cell wall biosynthesis
MQARRRRPLVYDASHLTTRLQGVTTTGIDWVDRAYARYLTGNERLACGLHYGAFSPHVLAPECVAALSKFHESKFNSDSSSRTSSGWRRLRAWLTGQDDCSHSSTPVRRQFCELAERVAALSLMTRTRLTHDRKREIPRDAVYLNVAQYGLEYGRLFDWLDRRPDIMPVFLAHDLLPFDYPEYFRDGYEARFRMRVETIMRRARAIITTSHCTADRIAEEFRACGRLCPPINVAPLASPLEGARKSELHDPELSATPYFVMIATIEPRKNHLLLLNIWRDLAAAGAKTPKLVCVGGRGWSSAQTLDVFEQSAKLSSHVRSVSGLPSPDLRLLLANARALLAPSFAEGYGIPLVEAFEVGAPVICSDIPVFREVTQNCATFLSPLDGAGWRSAIRQFARDDSLVRDEAKRRARAFKAPSWIEYFVGVESFVNSL